MNGFEGGGRREKKKPKPKPHIACSSSLLTARFPPAHAHAPKAGAPPWHCSMCAQKHGASLANRMRSIQANLHLLKRGNDNKKQNSASKRFRAPGRLCSTGGCAAAMPAHRVPPQPAAELQPGHSPGSIGQPGLAIPYYFLLLLPPNHKKIRNSLQFLRNPVCATISFTAHKPHGCFLMVSCAPRHQRSLGALAQPRSSVTLWLLEKSRKRRRERGAWIIDHTRKYKTEQNCRIELMSPQSLVDGGKDAVLWIS